MGEKIGAIKVRSRRGMVVHSYRVPLSGLTTVRHSSSNCHVTVAARLNKLHQTRALLGFCVLVFLHACFLIKICFFGRLFIRPAVIGGFAL
ncbi:hypothetical protein D9M73_218350 [compost metagenome]